MKYDFQTHPISYSDLKYIEESWDRYKFEKNKPREDKPAFAIGSYFESLLLGEDTSEFVIGDGRSKEVKEAKEEGKRHLGIKDAEMVHNMLVACDNNPDLYWLDENFSAQQYLHGNLRGVDCKGYADIITEDRIIDIKTIDSLANIDKAVSNGYYLQAAMYQALYFQMTDKFLPFYFFFIEKKAPHYTWLGEIPQDYIEAGKLKIFDILGKVKDCREKDLNGEFTGFDLKLKKPKYLK